MRLLLRLQPKLKDAPPLRVNPEVKEPQCCPSHWLLVSKSPPHRSPLFEPATACPRYLPSAAFVYIHLRTSKCSASVVSRRGTKSPLSKCESFDFHEHHHSAMTVAAQAGHASKVHAVQCPIPCSRLMLLHSHHHTDIALLGDSGPPQTSAPSAAPTPPSLRSTLPVSHSVYRSPPETSLMKMDRPPEFLLRRRCRNTSSCLTLVSVLRHRFLDLAYLLPDTPLFTLACAQLSPTSLSCSCRAPDKHNLCVSSLPPPIKDSTRPPASPTPQKRP